jgi:signal transduction histidine kinase
MTPRIADCDEEKAPVPPNSLAEMRALIFELRPESLESEGLVAALAKQGAALQARHDMLIQLVCCSLPVCERSR